MERVAIDDGAPIKCIYGGDYYFNEEPSGISYFSVDIGETVVCIEGGIIRENLFWCSWVCTAGCICVVIEGYLVSVGTDDGMWHFVEGIQ